MIGRWIHTKSGEDNKEILSLGNQNNSTLYYALVIKHHHPITSTFGDTRGRLEREREICAHSLTGSLYSNVCCGYGAR